jgi:hypothetical protein
MWARPAGAVRSRVGLVLFSRWSGFLLYFALFGAFLLLVLSLPLTSPALSSRFAIVALTPANVVSIIGIAAQRIMN